MTRVIDNNMIFLSENYGEYSTVSATSADSGSIALGYDNRSDAGNVTWPTTSADYTYWFGSSTTFNVDSFFINNHNLKTGNIQIHTGTTWGTLTTFSSLTADSYYYKHSSTITAYGVKYLFSAVQAGTTAYAGELIACRQLFQLTYNPDLYKPTISPVGRSIKLYDGRLVFNEVGNIFSAQIGWTFLFGDASTITNTDLQNMTELAVSKGSFLFWPNANSNFLNMRTWQKKDVYKCKILNAVSYEFPSPAIAHAIIADYTIEESR
jgi:hypothetical protein